MTRPLSADGTSHVPHTHPPHSRRRCSETSVSKTSRNHLNIEAERTEAVVATNHGTHGILHPTVVKVSFTSGQRLYERLHGAPRRRAHTCRTRAVNGNPLLPLPDIASVLDGVLELGHQVWIDRLSNSCYSNFVHAHIVCGTRARLTLSYAKPTMCHVAKVQLFSEKTIDNGQKLTKRDNK